MEGCDEGKYCRNRCQVGVGGLSTEAQRDLVAGESSVGVMTGHKSNYGRL